MSRKRHSLKQLMTAVHHVAEAIKAVGYSCARKCLEEVIDLDRSERRIMARMRKSSEKDSK